MRKYKMPQKCNQWIRHRLHMNQRILKTRTFHGPKTQLIGKTYYKNCTNYTYWTFSLPLFGTILSKILTWHIWRVSNRKYFLCNQIFINLNQSHLIEFWNCRMDTKTSTLYLLEIQVMWEGTMQLIWTMVFIPEENKRRFWSASWSF